MNLRIIKACLVAMIFAICLHSSIQRSAHSIRLPLSTRKLSRKHANIIPLKANNNPLIPLESNGHTDVYLCGTAHVSTRSCEEVKELIRSVKPELILLELCSQRISMLHTQSIPTNVTLFSCLRSVRKGECNFVEALLVWMQASTARLLKVKPGEEFRVAMNESKHLGETTKVMLIDRPSSITIARTLESLTLWQRVRLVFAVLWSHVCINPLSLTKWMDKQLNETDVVNDEILELGKAFPSLVDVIIHERDRYMLARLRECCDLLKPSSIVAVVGAGHIKGLVDMWNETENFDFKALRQISVSKSGNEVYSPFPITLTADILKCDGHISESKQGGFKSPVDEFPPLRFNNGDKVFLKDSAGLFLRGKVVCGWYYLDQFMKEQNPDLPDFVAYLVRSEFNNYVVVPVDDEAYICKDSFFDRMENEQDPAVCER